MNHRVTEPEPPDNVRLVLDDETEVPVHCRYEGRDEGGIHQWAVMVPAFVARRVRSVRAGVVPGSSTLRMVVVDP
jgi:hypothetical protein